MKKKNILPLSLISHKQTSISSLDFPSWEDYLTLQAKEEKGHNSAWSSDNYIFICFLALHYHTYKKQSIKKSSHPYNCFLRWKSMCLLLASKYSLFKKSYRQLNTNLGRKLCIWSSSIDICESILKLETEIGLWLAAPDTKQ